MKRWWSKVARDYFTFTKKERTGIFVAIVAGLVVYTVLASITPKKEEINKDSFAQELADLKITIDSSQPYRSYRNDDHSNDDYYRPKSFEVNKTVKGELFVFDPNTLDPNGWKRLGVRDKTINTIQNFVAKGFKFRRPEDIKRVYGLHENEANRLIPFIRIAESNFSQNTSSNYAGSASNSPSNFTASSTGYPSKPAYKTRIIDVNTADTSAFISLPGIGSKLAARIVNFREKLGGFTSVEQVAETYGVPDSTFQKIRTMLQCTPNVRTFDINTVDANELKNHPYIKWNIANAIINYRKQHGNYRSVDDLKKIEIISEEIFQKIAPYLKAS